MDPERGELVVGFMKGVECSITIEDHKLENVTKESITVETEKQSLFVKIHVVTETLMTLRIPLLYEVGIEREIEV